MPRYIEKHQYFSDRNSAEVQKRYYESLQTPEDKMYHPVTIGGGNGKPWVLNYTVKQ